MSCHSIDCESPDVATVYWPGSVPAPRMCFSCTLRALHVAEAMGCALAFQLDATLIPLPPTPAQLLCAQCNEYGCTCTAPTVRP